MRICFIWPGKTKDERLRSLIAEYLKRLQRFVRCEVIETREVRASLEKESQRLLEAIPGKERGHPAGCEGARMEFDGTRRRAAALGKRFGQGSCDRDWWSGWSQLRSDKSGANTLAVITFDADA